MPVAIMIALAGAGTAISVIGQVKAGNAAKRAGEAERRAAESEADLSDYNASVADLQAQDAIARGMLDENQFRTSVKGLIGSERAGIAAGNVDVGFGSAVDVQADAAYLGELDARQIRLNAKREAWGYQVQGEDLRKRGQIQRTEGVMLAKAGGQRQTASRYAAVGSILGTTSSLLQAKYGWGGK